MIPILYERAEQSFTTNGIGRLSDCISCTVTEERNGIYECEFQYPITGAHYSDIVEGNTIILVTHDETGDMQPFDIYGRSAPIDGIVTFYAHHISYRLNDIVVMPFTAGSCAAALQGIAQNSAPGNPFSFWTDKATSGNYENDVPNSARAMLGGQENSILDVYGTGDYEFDRFTVKLHASRGTASGVEIRYGKNLTDIQHEIDASDTYNAVVPYWAGTDGNVVTLPEVLLVYSGAPSLTASLTEENFIILRDENNNPIELNYKITDAIPLDMSDAFDEEPTAAELRAAATTRLENSNAWLPSETIDVDFVALWQTDEYKSFAPLQRVHLCDTVSVYYEALGVNAVNKKVIKTVYNVLLDRYDSIELGTPSVSLASAVTSAIEAGGEIPTVSMMTKAVQHATELISGGLGGYVVLKTNANGKPEELLILDDEDIDQAVNVWRWNMGGLGHSSNGYNGPYDDVAITMDGAINADAITVGNLWANLITAGRISSANGRVYFDLDNNVLACSLIVSASEEQYAREIGLTIDRTLVETGTYSSAYLSYASIYDENYPTEGIKIIPYGAARTNGNIYINRIERNYILADELIDVLVKIPSGDSNVEGWAGLLVGNISDEATTMIYAGPSGDSSQAQIDVVKNLTSASSNSRISMIATNIYMSPGNQVQVSGAFTVIGTKSRQVKTDNYDDRLLYCYETPTPMFGDIGEAVIGEDGYCYVDLDDIFSETVEEKVEYQVFLQKEGQGDCWVASKEQRYFIIQGTPGLKVAWELKTKQKGYHNIRLEQPEGYLDEYIEYVDEQIEDYITEQEALLYGDY